MRKFFPKEGKQVEKLFPVPFMAFSEGGVGETALWGRNARKIIQWMIFSEGRAAAPDSKERFPPQTFP
ncbi:MAG: hypothetical protein IKH30_03815 [Clostridia bacterium]|nr:hypothetical protein [Clostridia bacterium]MBR4538352.1 hypothetical protein [Clostridia bacterium]